MAYMTERAKMLFRMPARTLRAIPVGTHLKIMAWVDNSPYYNSPARIMGCAYDTNNNNAALCEPWIYQSYQDTHCARTALYRRTGLRPRPFDKIKISEFA